MSDVLQLAREVDFLWRFPRTLVDGEDVLTFGSAGINFSEFVACLDRRTGKQRWRFGEDGSNLYDPMGLAAVDGQRVFVGRRDGTICALSRGTGELVWRKPVGGREAIPAPAVHRGRLLAFAPPDQLVELDPRDGRRRGASTIPALGGAGPGARAVLQPRDAVLLAASADGVLVEAAGAWGALALHDVDAFALSSAALFASRGGDLLSLSLFDGTLLWSVPAEAEVRRLATDGRILWASGVGGVVGAYDALSGAPLWSRRLPTASSMAASRGNLYLDHRARVTVLQGATGVTVAELPADGDPYGPLVVADGQLLAGRACEPDLLLLSLAIAPGAPAWRTTVGSYGTT